jgi:hypothetical protein
MSAELVLPQPPGVEVSRTSLQVIEIPTSEQLEIVLNEVVGMGDSVRWWVGDLLLFAEMNFREEYAQILNATRLTEHQLGKYRWVAEKIEPPLRRVNLSFSHHELVAALPPVDQERLLATAEAGELSVAAFREAIKDHKAITAPPPRRIVVPIDTTAVDAARGLRAAREALRTIGTNMSAEAQETLQIGPAIRGLDAAAQMVKRIDPLEEVLTAVERVITEGVEQIGLADPAVIVPSGAWANLLAAHQRATEGRPHGGQ